MTDRGLRRRLRENGLSLSDLRRWLLVDVVLSGAIGSAVVPPKLRWLLLRACGLQVARSVWGAGSHIGGTDIVVGGGSYLGPRCFLDASSTVTIGVDVRLGHEVMLVTSSHAPGSTRRRAGPNTAAPVRIGDGCWLGARVTVLPGVTVAAGCVVAAGAVVTEDTERDGLYVGVPARRVRDLP